MASVHSCLAQIVSPTGPTDPDPKKAYLKPKKLGEGDRWGRLMRLAALVQRSASHLAEEGRSRTGGSGKRLEVATPRGW